MSSARTTDLSMRFNRWIERLSPPRVIAGNPRALDDEVKALFNIVLNYAPTANWAQWWDDTIAELEAGMMTRSWPAPGEVVRACQAYRPEGSKSDHGTNSLVEANAIKMLTDWYHKFGDQMPGMGRADRTNELIRRGIFRNEREARFCGFTFAPDAFAKASLEDQEPSPAENEHHLGVISRFAPASEQDEADCKGNSPEGFCSIGDAAARVAP